MLSSHLHSTNILPKPYNSSFLVKLANLDILPVKIACGRGCAGTGGSGNRTKLSPTLNKMLSSRLYSTNTLPEPYNSSFLVKLANLDILPVKIACGRGCAGTGGSGNRTKLSLTLNKMLSSRLYSTNTLPEPYNSSFLLKLANLDILPVK